MPLRSVPPPSSIFASTIFTTMKGNITHDSAEFSCDDGLESLGKRSGHSTASSARSSSSWEELYDRSRSFRIRAKPPPKLTVHIDISEDEPMITLTNLHPMETIARIQQRLSKKINIPPEQQTLMLGETKLDPTADVALIDSNITNGCTIQLFRMMISVQINRTEIVQVPFSSDMAVWEVEEYLAEKHDEIDEDELMLGFKGLILDEPERLLESYHITENDTIEVISRL